jgi:hypothetical protein
MIALILSIVVATVAYPAFQKEFGFPRSLIWTLLCIGALWAAYFIRAFLSGDKDRQKRRGTP